MSELGSRSNDTDRGETVPYLEWTEIKVPRGSYFDPTGKEVDVNLYTEAFYGNGESKKRWNEARESISTILNKSGDREKEFAEVISKFGELFEEMTKYYEEGYRIMTGVDFDKPNIRKAFLDASQDAVREFSSFVTPTNTCPGAFDDGSEAFKDLVETCSKMEQNYSKGLQTVDYWKLTLIQNKDEITIIGGENDA